MMSIALHEAEPSTTYGGKVNGLIQLIQAGFPVPQGRIVLLGNEQSFLADEGLIDFIQDGRPYIVRSSALDEDGQEASFAGLYQSIGDCYGVDQVLAALKACAQAGQTSKVETYRAHQGQLPVQSAVTLLVQEQLVADYSGVSFAVSPLGQHDQEWSVEYLAGAGHDLVDGKRQPHTFSASWFEDLVLDASQPLSVEVLSQLRSLTLAVSCHFGYPVDMEFVLVDQTIWLVQARPITRLSDVVATGSWTTANFRDGGVAAQSCPLLMASLYDTAWEKALRSFLFDHQLLATDQTAPLMTYHYARPYWNVGLVKEAMAKIPGYVEREFDEELGIRKTYEGDGRVASLSLASLWHLIKVARLLTKTSRQWFAQAPQTHQDLLNRSAMLQKDLEKQRSLEELELAWKGLIEGDYLTNETTYFTQVFINTVQFSLKKNRLIKQVGAQNFFELVASLGNVSHTRLRAAIEAVATEVGQDEALKVLWLTSSPQALYQQLDPERSSDAKLLTIMTEFGYHSKRELYLLEPSFSETPLVFVEMVQQALREHELPRSQPVTTAVARPEPASAKSGIEHLRTILWWREEFKDLSTRYYHLVRQLTLQLGQAYLAQGWVTAAEDLFYCPWQLIVQVIEDKSRLEELRKRAVANRLYCQIYQKARIPGELWSQPMAVVSQARQPHLTGLAASSGQVTAPVRVLRDVMQLEAVEPGEILVTPFTDTGWSPVFGRLAGLITETGGVLCHASIVAREYQLPTLVCVDGACDRLKTGMVVTLDTLTGRVIIEKE